MIAVLRRGARRARVDETRRGDQPARAPRHLPVAARLARYRIATDVAMICVAAAVEALTAEMAGVVSTPIGWRILFAVGVLGHLLARGRYRSALGVRRLFQVRSIVSATAVTAMMITFVRVLFTDAPDIAEQAFRQWLFAAVYMGAGRVALDLTAGRFWTLRGSGAPTVIIGAGRVGHLVARRLLMKPGLGLRPIGFLDANPREVEQSSPLPLLGSDRDLERVIAEHRVEHAIVSFSQASTDEQLKLARSLTKMGVSISVIPRLFESMPDRIRLQRVEGLPFVTMDYTDPGGWRIAVKYGMDRVIALVAIVGAAPVFAVGAVGTLITLGRPVLFRQPRIGLDGREFEMLKFRTLPGSPVEHGEADAEWAATAAEPSGKYEATDADPRGEDRGPGGLGAIMRRTGLDELPQLFNVIRGEMSIVGPRPERTAYVELFERNVSRYDDRHRLKTGITGWAQVNGYRGETSLEDRVEWDNYYIENWSLWLDLKILALTVVAVFRR